MWDYDVLKERRVEVGSRVWATSYLMQSTDFSTQIFTKEAIEACFNTNYGLGDKPEQVTHTYLGVDPAVGDYGYCAIITWALDKRTGQRYLIDIFNRRGMRSYRAIQDVIADKVQKHGVNVVAIEQAATQQGIYDDDEFRKRLRALGCAIVPYKTRTNMGARAEHDDYDISNIGALFDEGLISLPYMDTDTRKVVNAYRDQLLEWQPKPPGTKSWSLVRDMVMGTLFGESEAYKEMLRRPVETQRKNRAPLWARDRADRWRRKPADLPLTPV